MTSRLATISYLVHDYDEALAWFVGVLGFEKIADEDLGCGRRWVVVAASDGGSRLLLARAEGERQKARIGDQSGGRVFLFLETDDFDAEHERLSRAGVTFNEAPRLETYGKVAVFRDFQGNLWDLIQPS